MSLARALLILCGVLVVSACGSSKSSVQPADEGQAAPPPPIEAIDEPAPDDFWATPPADAGTAGTYICLGRKADTAGQEECKPTPAQKEELRRIEEEIEQATKPATGSEPRAVALLRLKDRGPKSRALLIAWRNRSDKLCLGSREKDEDGGSSSGPFGPCVPKDRCQEICLNFSGDGSGSETLYMLVGVLPARGDRLRVTLDDGRVFTYELRGPLVPGFPEYRVFMLDLGRGLDERLELLEGDKVIAEERRSRAEIKLMRCDEDFPPVLPSQGAQGRRSPLDECLKKAGPE